MESKNSKNSNQIKNPEIAMPKGGGAITGIGETFQPNGFTGTGSYSIPIPTAPARGSQPNLSVNYNSGAGNSPFGIGFDLALPKISIRTEKGIPKYEGNDIFTMGADELVLKQNPIIKDDEGWDVYEYLPRVESSFSRIEQHVKEDKSESYWKVISSNNETSFFGRTNQSRIYNPATTSQIFEWLIDQKIDAKGNEILYTYKAENREGMPNKIWNQNRSFNNKYIQTIKYGNYKDGDGTNQFGFEVVFDYGEYDLSKLDEGGKNPYKQVSTWKHRPDAFSSYLSGFEIRTCRLCHNILIFHHFEKELGAPSLVKNVSLKYKHSNNYNKTESTGLSTLHKVTLTGYKRMGIKEDDPFEIQQLPSTILEFSTFSPPQTPEFKQLEINGNTIPGYLNNLDFQPIDLNGEGIAGLLYHAGKSLLYCQPLGDGKYATPATPNKFPIDRNFDNGTVSLVDLDSNGELELVVNEAGRSGFYQKTQDGFWKNYQAFESYPTDTSDPELEMVSLSNNGKTDLLLVEESEILVFPSIGKKGYSIAEKRLKPEEFPSKKKGYEKEWIGFANMLGDGLSHRIKISNGNVECWPDLGYGNFGEKITLGNAPLFENNFDTSRIYLADVDGSGTIDIIYVYSDRVELFINNSGNFFSDAITVYLPRPFSSIDQISFSDIEGNGTTCLVFTSIEPSTTHYYYDFVGETLIDGIKQKSMKPYLLYEIDNNLGSVTQVQYCSSTKFYLEDKMNGKPWITKLPFPVQLIEKSIVLDKVSGSRYTQSFKYHEGYYDTFEREFKGFGFVESWDTEKFATLTKNNKRQETQIDEIKEENYIAAKYTKTWHETGAYLNHSIISAQYRNEFYKGDKEAYDFPNSVFENPISELGFETVRQAYVALSGQVIRTEVYGEDSRLNPELYKIPYTVEESNMEVKLLQEIGKESYAIFMVNPRESISYNYERNPKDPNVQQSFILKVDAFGNEMQSCNVFLPRRSNILSEQIVYPEQQQLSSIITLSEYVIPLEGYLYCHTQCEAQELQLFGLDLKGKLYFDFDEIKGQATLALQTIIPYDGILTPDTPEARQVSWNRTYFWDKHQSNRLPLRYISIRALVYNYEKNVFTKAFVTEVFGDRITNETIQDYGGYFFDEELGYWLNKGLVQYYFTPESPESFYMPYKTENSFVDKSVSYYSETVVEYDAYFLAQKKVSQYVDDTTNNSVVAETDYVSFQPKQIIDVNGNTTQILYDALGQVIVISLFGTEDGQAKGAMTLYPDCQTPAEYINPGKATFAEVIENPEKYLQGASSYFFYDLNAWSENQQPTCSINLVRNFYWNSLNKDKTPYCQMAINYSDGLGRDLEKKLLVDSGVSFIRDEYGVLLLDEANIPIEEIVDSRWQVTGRTVYNNKGLPIEQYLPYFINTPLYEDQKDVPGPSPTVIYYDALGRKIRVDTPKGFFAKTEFTPWKEVLFDEDDTVLDSKYYEENYPQNLNPGQLDAINKAIKFYNTPTIKINDNTGSVFLEIKNNLGNVSQDAFKEIVKSTSITSKEVWDELVLKEYLEIDKIRSGYTWVTSKFRPYTKGFKLELDDKFNALIDPITAILQQNELTSYYSKDISGRTIESIDARLYYSNQSKDTNYYNFKYRYAMEDETPVLVNSIDAGTERHLNTFFGDLFWSWSPRNYCQLITYDALYRRTHLRVKKIIDSEPIVPFEEFNLVEVFTYGESQPEAQQSNLKGQLYELKDLSGIIVNDQYSMLEEVLHTSRQMIKHKATAVNWNDDPELEKEVYPTSFTYNAINQNLSQTTPDGSITNKLYNQAGQLYNVSVVYTDSNVQQIINLIEYDSNGQRTLIKYGNLVNTRYDYEDTTLRLKSIKSTRPVEDGENPELQDLEYYYDPVGNITRTQDFTIDTVFSKNQKVDPISNYTYDAIYQLILANGRQHQGISASTYKNNASNGSFKQCIYGPPPSTEDADKLENYSEVYTYDDSGNLIKKQHIATSSSWTRELPVEDNSNRLKNSEYDKSGNMRNLEINNAVDLSFNCCENMVKAGIIERPDELDDTDYYLYDSQEIRTRKLSERMEHEGTVKRSEEKTYLGNYEIKRNYTGSKEDKSNITYERQILRVMDDTSCVAIIYFIAIDKQNPEKENTRQCRFQMDNNLGSVALELDTDAKLITYEEYFPYGGTAIITGISQSEVKLKVYRYSGKERDDSTGLYYYGARYYASWLGRWIKPDPAGTVDGMNLYAFVKGNPIGNVDPNGLMLNDVSQVADPNVRAQIQRAMPRNLPLLQGARQRLTNPNDNTRRLVGRWLGREEDANQAELQEITASVDTLIDMYRQGEPPTPPERSTGFLGFFTNLFNDTLHAINTYNTPAPITEIFTEGTVEERQGDAAGRPLMSVNGLLGQFSPISVYSDNLSDDYLNDNSNESSLFASHTILHEQFHKYTGADDISYIDSQDNMGMVTYRDAGRRRRRRDETRVNLDDQLISPLTRNADTLAGIVAQLGYTGNYNTYRTRYFRHSFMDQLSHTLGGVGRALGGVFRGLI